MTTRQLLSTRWRSRWISLRRFLGQWAWTPIVRRILVWLGAFAALAHVGTGAAARLVGGADGSSSGWTAAATHGANQPPVTPSQLGPPAASSRGGPERAGNQPDGGVDHPALTDDGKVILNLASVPDLVRLPAIGPKRARAIVELRERLGGRFRRVRDLLRIRGIGHRTLRRIEPLVVLDPPAR